MAFYRVPTEFLLAIVCVLTALPLRVLGFHGAHTVCTALSRRSHCADGTNDRLATSTTAAAVLLLLHYYYYYYYYWSISYFYYDFYF